MDRERKENRMTQKKREWHKLPYTNIVKSETIASIKSMFLVKNYIQIKTKPLARTVADIVDKFFKN